MDRKECIGCIKIKGCNQRAYDYSCWRGGKKTINTIETLQKIQDSEINFQILTFWDSGFTVHLGDDMNGIKEEIYSDSLQEGVDKLVEKVLKHYPKSKFTKGYIK